MTHLDRLVAAVALALPLAAFAQSPSPNIKPADQPRSQLEQEQTTKNGQATQYPGPATESGTDAMSGPKHANGMKHKAMKSGKASTTKPGDVPTYPAPAPDGTPTK